MPTDAETLARLHRAFAHWVYRNHDYRPTCLGCVEAAAFLAIPGYKGNLDDPLIY